MTAATDQHCEVLSASDSVRDATDGDGVVDDAVTDAVLTVTSQLVDAVRTAFVTSLDGSISPAQFELMVALRDRGPMKLTELADHLGVNPSTSNRMVTRLVDAGMVDRHVNPAVRREVVLEVTDAGAATLRTVAVRRRSQLNDIVGHIPEQSRYHLVEGLRAFTEAGGESVGVGTATPSGGRSGRRRRSH